MTKSECQKLDETPGRMVRATREIRHSTFVIFPKGVRGELNPPPRLSQSRMPTVTPRTPSHDFGSGISDFGFDMCHSRAVRQIRDHKSEIQNGLPRPGLEPGTSR